MLAIALDAATAQRNLRSGASSIVESSVCRSQRPVQEAHDSILHPATLHQSAKDGHSIHQSATRYCCCHLSCHSLVVTTQAGVLQMEHTNWISSLTARARHDKCYQLPHMLPQAFAAARLQLVSRSSPESAGCEVPPSRQAALPGSETPLCHTASSCQDRPHGLASAALIPCAARQASANQASARAVSKLREVCQKIQAHLMSCICVARRPLMKSSGSAAKPCRTAKRRLWSLAVAVRAASRASTWGRQATSEPHHLDAKLCPCLESCRAYSRSGAWGQG